MAPEYLVPSSVATCTVAAVFMAAILARSIVRSPAKSVETTALPSLTLFREPFTTEPSVRVMRSAWTNRVAARRTIRDERSFFMEDFA